MDRPSEIIPITTDRITSLIYTVRGQQVMLDSDLAMLFQVETKRLNESVSRNLDRFPEEFCFRITKGEDDVLRSQIATSNEPSGSGGRRHLPRVFTEQGIAMLSAILRSDVAVQVSIQIMKSFVEMRHFLASNAQLLERIRNIELEQASNQKRNDARFEEVFGYIEKQLPPLQSIFFDGQVYDAFTLLVSLVQEAKESIILIDGYVDIATLNILSKKNTGVSVAIHTKSTSRLTSQDISAFNSQYPHLAVSYTDVFHDRFLILDNEIGYHIGASLKDAGKRCFGINRINDDSIIQDILNRLH